MKKTIVKLLCVALVLCSLLCLAGCAMGTYKLKSASVGGLSVSLESVGMDPDDYYLEMSPFGTAVFCFNGEEKDMKYGDGKIWPADDEDDAVDMEIDGDEIILELPGVSLTFEK